MNEEKLANKLLEFIEDLDMSKISISQSLKSSFSDYKKIAYQVLTQQNIDIKNEDINIKNYASYISKEGNIREKAEFVRGLGIPLYLYNKNIYLEPTKIN